MQRSLECCVNVNAANAFAAFQSGLRKALTSLVAALGDITLKRVNPEKTLWGH